MANMFSPSLRALLVAIAAPLLSSASLLNSEISSHHVALQDSIQSEVLVEKRYLRQQTEESKEGAWGGGETMDTILNRESLLHNQESTQTIETILEETGEQTKDSEVPWEAGVDMDVVLSKAHMQGKDEKHVEAKPDTREIKDKGTPVSDNTGDKKQTKEATPDEKQLKAAWEYGVDMDEVLSTHTNVGTDGVNSDVTESGESKNSEQMNKKDTQENSRIEVQYTEEELQKLWEEGFDI